MTGVWRSFWGGWRRSAAIWPAVMLLYLVDSALALMATIPAAAPLASVFGHSSMAPELLGPVSLSWLIEIQEAGNLGVIPFILFLLAPLPFLLLTTFLRGGVLGALAADEPDFRWAVFFADCARYFWRLLLLLLFVVPGLLVVLLVFLLGLRISFVPGTSALSLLPILLRGVLLALLLFLLLASLDYARISLVLEPGRSLFRHAGRGLKFAVVHFPKVLLLGLGFWTIAAIIAILYPGLLQLSPTFDAFWPALLAQQLTVLLASWQRVAMLGGQMRLFAFEHRDEVPALE